MMGVVLTATGVESKQGGDQPSHCSQVKLLITNFKVLFQRLFILKVIITLKHEKNALQTANSFSKWKKKLVTFP